MKRILLFLSLGVFLGGCTQSETVYIREVVVIKEKSKPVEKIVLKEPRIIMTNITTNMTTNLSTNLITNLITNIVVMLEEKKVEPIAPKEPIEFGPFFMPEDRAFNSISLNYFTEKMENTTVYFSIMGDIDWLRNDYAETRYHKMNFSGLEEGRNYIFKLGSQSPRLAKESRFLTKPYGNEAEFHFGIATVGEPIHFEKIPHFLILLSDKGTLDEVEFQSFYRQNEAILSSTVMIPLFDFSVRDVAFSVSDNGFHYMRYNNTMLIFVFKDFDKLDYIERCISTDVKDRNYIIIGTKNSETVSEIVNRYGGRVDDIFVFDNQNKLHATSIGHKILVKVAKKDNYSIKGRK